MQSTPASISMQRALVALVADRRGGGDAQPPFGILAGIGIQRRLLDVLDGDEADAAIILVDDEQLLDAVLVQEPARLVLGDAAFAHGDELLASSIPRPAACGSSAKRTSRLVRMPHELRRLAACAALDDRNARRCRGAASAPARRPASRPERW